MVRFLLKTGNETNGYVAFMPPISAWVLQRFKMWLGSILRWLKVSRVEAPLGLKLTLKVSGKDGDWVWNSLSSQPEGLKVRAPTLGPAAVPQPKLVCF